MFCATDLLMENTESRSCLSSFPLPVDVLLGPITLFPPILLHTASLLDGEATLGEVMVTSCFLCCSLREQAVTVEHGQQRWGHGSETRAEDRCPSTLVLSPDKTLDGSHPIAVPLMHLLHVVTLQAQLLWVIVIFCTGPLIRCSCPFTT